MEIASESCVVVLLAEPSSICSVEISQALHCPKAARAGLTHVKYLTPTQKMSGSRHRPCLARCALSKQSALTAW